MIQSVSFLLLVLICIYVHACMCVLVSVHVHECVYVCRYVHINADATRYQKKTLHLLKLELEIVVNHLMWVLEPNSKCMCS